MPSSLSKLYKLHKIELETCKMNLDFQVVLVVEAAVVLGFAYGADDGDGSLLMAEDVGGGHGQKSGENDLPETKSKLHYLLRAADDGGRYRFHGEVVRVSGELTLKVSGSVRLIYGRHFGKERWSSGRVE